ncbi:MAG: helix-turn-helix transcriptional regulator [Lentisphaerae bacterium]|nr:helix-turn-helix transcriptional regulator [Lentisphaerota bacterium]MCP4103751.1 helix-turn-helix transcriptional regulator [Lentisphaerota bacterium]
MESDYKIKLISQLKKFIDENNITQQQVADDLKISGTTICRWISGERGIAKRHRGAIKEYISKPYKKVNIGKERINIDNWPLTDKNAQDVMNYLSLPENRAKLFRLLAEIEEHKN